MMKTDSDSFLNALCFYTITAAARMTTMAPPDSLDHRRICHGSLKNFPARWTRSRRCRWTTKIRSINPLDAIRGRVAGLTIQHGSNGTATLDAVRLRGTTSLTSGNNPLIIVDGVFGDLSLLQSIYPSTDIESFTILKGCLGDFCNTDRAGLRVSSR